MTNELTNPRVVPAPLVSHPLPVGRIMFPHMRLPEGLCSSADALAYTPLGHNPMNFVMATALCHVFVLGSILFGCPSQHAPVQRLSEPQQCFCHPSGMSELCQVSHTMRMCAHAALLLRTTMPHNTLDDACRSILKPRWRTWMSWRLCFKYLSWLVLSTGDPLAHQQAVS